ncbi:hypothetical protein PCL_05370 [Purpureocillium lilacinum]|uniref:Uncharacterized protein n=1 Tax=Purpureocillium lilacinum TaxID=33203 RepID=A0A2U3DV74_PURLI|nr:hypothetical protein PCL_05370 [Purpureocillium lilacinum]
MQHDSFTPPAHKYSPIFSIRTNNMVDQEPIRVVICGKSEEVGRGIIAGLQPEVEGTPDPSMTHTVSQLLPLRRDPPHAVTGGEHRLTSARVADSSDPLWALAGGPRGGAAGRAGGAGAGVGVERARHGELPGGARGKAEAAAGGGVWGCVGRGGRGDGAGGGARLRRGGGRGGDAAA